MSTDPIVEMHTLGQLRSSFDHSFGVPAQVHKMGESVILIRAGGEGFAVSTGHIAGLVKSRKVVPLPSGIPEVLGLAAIRGSLIPVYDLAALLGIASGQTAPAWLLLVPGETPFGLAFDGFEGQQVPEWLSEEPGARQHVRQLVRIGPAVRAVLDIPGIAEIIRKRAGITEPAKEKEK